MQDDTLESLEAAYRATPDNLALLLVLLKAYGEADQWSRGYPLVSGKEPAAFHKPEERLLLARVCWAAKDPQTALSFLETEPLDLPQADLLRARLLLALERNDEGRRAYERAVRNNPTLEDPDLASRLAARIRVFQKEESGGQRLRVVSNDDTDDTETHRLLMPKQETVTFDQVGGLEAIKALIHKRIILPFQKPSLFQRFKKRVGGGILLYGPPGCGKTLLARATAGECEAEFFSVAISDILDMYIGESERKLHAIFEKARQTTPTVLFFDEIEALGGKRQYTREATASKLVSQFLSELDGFTQNNQGVLVLAATNVPWAIDPAFRRPGRFDRVLFVPPPDREARQRILEIMLDQRPQQAELRLDLLAQRTSGFSGADLDHLVETAADCAIEESLERGDEVPISMEHLNDSLGTVKNTTLEWLTTARNYARYANEAGHYDDVLAFLKKHGK